MLFQTYKAVSHLLKKIAPSQLMFCCLIQIIVLAGKCGVIRLSNTRVYNFIAY